ncbi:defensin-like protein 1 [Ananas comosus]|uniref:Defensin-like protein 1 n=1 Tax=Ananas comosus TaxID=4615 RepID=A0A6P5EC39_ANACO|nr:defensin-like protein 1 [Ananas comosus]
MERKDVKIGLVLLLLVVFDSGMATIGEARLCESQSHRFKGTCLNDDNCAVVCQHEGFSGGRCRGFWRKCYCTKQCI